MKWDIIIIIRSVVQLIGHVSLPLPCLQFVAFFFLANCVLHFFIELDKIRRVLFFHLSKCCLTYVQLSLSEGNGNSNSDTTTTIFLRMVSSPIYKGNFLKIVFPNMRSIVDLLDLKCGTI